MSAPRIIGLTGRAGAGKDTAAGIFSKHHKHVIVAFADPLYYGLSVMLNIPLDRLKDRDGKETPITGLGISPRQLLQTLGTEWGRELVHPDIWTLILVNKIKTLTDNGLSVVVTDIRFANEADTLREMGGEILHVQRDDVTPVREHLSENREVWQVADMTLDNNGTIADLENAILLRWPVGLAAANGVH